jgi:hypothetical protein
MAGGRRRRRAGATTPFTALLLAMVAAGGGCEIAIGSAIPDFECVQGAAVCPGNEVCDPSSHQCVAPCSVTGCKGGLACDPSGSLCVVGEAGAGAEAATSDGAIPDGESSGEAQPPTDSGTAG